jgi:hypothetical protein
MRIAEVVDGATNQVNVLKAQAKAAQKRAKQAAAHLKLQKAQKALQKTVAQTGV